MTIMQCIAHPHRVVVATDTDSLVSTFDAAGERSEERHAHVAKMCVIPHMPAVMAVRGQSTLAYALFGAAQMVSSYDELDAQFPDLAAGTAAAMSPLNPAFADLFDAKHEITIAGWSGQAQQIVCALWQRPEAGASFERIDRAGTAEGGNMHVAPSPFANPDAPIEAPRRLSDHVRLAQLQVMRLRAEFPDCPAGGDLVVATVTRNAVTVELARAFYPRTQARLDADSEKPSTPTSGARPKRA